METYLRPMLCSSADVVPTGEDWALEPKLDGWRLVAHKTATRVQMYARSGAEYSGKLPYIEEVLRCLPDDTVLDGELIGRGWGDVQSVMTSGHGAHAPSDASPALTYVVFDITRCDGTDVRQYPWAQRRALLEKIRFDSLRVIVNAAGEATQEAHEAFLQLGVEGSVAKRRSSKYQCGGRSPAWVKIKPQSTAEAEIVGFKDGCGELDGLVGAFRVRMLGSDAETTVKCGTRERHEHATAHPDEWLGQVIEIKHHGIGKTGKPRHPQFLRRRDDREAETPRARQFREAAQRERLERQVVSEPPPPRMRNYKAMTDAKLLRVIHELATQGDAYERCVQRGSGEPLRDLAYTRQLAAERGLAA